jgi:hypothetical protein
MGLRRSKLGLVRMTVDCIFRISPIFKSTQYLGETVNVLRKNSELSRNQYVDISGISIFLLKLKKIVLRPS